MSDLQDLLKALNLVNQEADRLAVELTSRARQLGQAAAHAGAVGAGSNRALAVQTATALQAAQQAVTVAAHLLTHSAEMGKKFVVRNAGGGESLRGADRAGVEQPPFGAPELDRYLRPDNQVVAYFGQLVGVFGPDNPAGWIGAGNPSYRHQEEAWINNCGSCSRSFADTYQGISSYPALGDSGIPPGEYAEMWDAVGVQPTTAMTNNGQDPGAFTSIAFAELERKLAQQGPGTVAIIGVDWDREGVPRDFAGGHWFNAYVDGAGKVHWADEQIGAVSDWPPKYDTAIWRLEAVSRSSGTSSWKEVLL